MSSHPLPDDSYVLSSFLFTPQGPIKIMNMAKIKNDKIRNSDSARMMIIIVIVSMRTIRIKK